jgi:phosphoribosylanthranilate isomerase
VRPPLSQAVRVKLCGITREEDVRAAVAAGADAVGFVFAASSPRRVTAESASRLADLLPPFVAAVGVFAGDTAAQVREIAKAASIHVVQVHGDGVARELLADPRGLRVIPAVRLASAADASDLASRFPGAPAILCDSAARSDREGGSGVAFPWEWIERGENAAAGKGVATPIVLAGGLTPENVAEAVRRVRPHAVDVSTGVETAPGVKDARLMAAFVAAAKGALRPE